MSEFSPPPNISLKKTPLDPDSEVYVTLRNSAAIAESSKVIGGSVARDLINRYEARPDRVLQLLRPRMNRVFDNEPTNPLIRNDLETFAAIWMNLSPNHIDYIKERAPSIFRNPPFSGHSLNETPKDNVAEERFKRFCEALEKNEQVT